MKAKYKVRRFKHQKRYKNNDREIDSATLDQKVYKQFHHHEPVITLISVSELLSWKTVGNMTCENFLH